MRFLSAFDVEICPPPPPPPGVPQTQRGYIAFHPVGHVRQGVIPTAGCVPLAATCCREMGGLASLSVSLNGSAPITGILDLVRACALLTSVYHLLLHSQEVLW